jgi:hypothetical protein
METQNLWQSQRNANGNDSGFAHLGTAIEFASAPVLFPVVESIEMGSGKHKNRW